MYFDTLVQVPDLKKLCSCNAIKSGVSYAYYTLNRSYDPIKKYSLPKRICIGKIHDRQVGLIQPNSNFAKLFPQLLEPVLSRGETLIYLPYLAMVEEAKHIGLYEPLKKHFPDQFLSILALCLFNLCQGDLIADGFYDFHYHCFDGLDKALLSPTISKLWANLGGQEEEIAAFFQDFLTSYREKFGLSHQAIIDIDSTNFSTTCDIPLASPGFNKDHTHLPCIGQLFLTDRQTGVPLYSETYNGSLLDKSQASILIELLEEKGFESGLLCMDAGFWSKDILKEIEKKGDQLQYLIRVPEHTTAFKELVDIFREELPHNYTRFILSHSLFGTSIKRENKIFYVYFNPKNYSDSLAHLSNKTRKACSAISIKKRYETLPHSKYVNTWEKEKDENGRNFHFEANLEVFKELENAGWFVLCSSKEMSPQEAYEAYVGRVKGIEGTFRTEKSFLGAKVRRTHNEETYRGKTFILELTTILRKGLEYHFGPVFFKHKKTSLPRALGILSQYQITKRYGVVTPIQAMTKLQKEFLQALGLSEAKVKEQIRSLEIWD